MDVTAHEATTQGPPDVSDAQLRVARALHASLAAERMQQTRGAFPTQSALAMEVGATPNHLERKTADLARLAVPVSLHLAVILESGRRDSGRRIEPLRKIDKAKSHIRIWMEVAYYLGMALGWRLSQRLGGLR